MTRSSLRRGPRLELTLRVDRATSLRRRGLPVPPGASENGALAQLGERRNGIAEVAGSIPACSTNKNPERHCGIWALALPGLSLHSAHRVSCYETRPRGRPAGGAPAPLGGAGGPPRPRRFCCARRGWGSVGLSSRPSRG